MIIFECDTSKKQFRTNELVSPLNACQCGREFCEDCAKLEKSCDRGLWIDDVAAIAADNVNPA
jgi:hypothetical protein